jgi:hypothetical protein
MKDLNRFARQQVIREFPFMGQLPTGLQLHNADEFSIRRMDEGLLRSRAMEDSWREQGDSLHDDTKFFFVNDGKFCGSVSVDLMVAEALTKLPDFILEFRYRDINRSDYRLELILWKRPKDAQLLQNVICRLGEQAQSELAGEVSAADGEDDSLLFPKVDSFDGVAKGVEFVCANIGQEVSAAGKCYWQLGIRLGGFPFSGFTIDPDFLKENPRVLHCDEIRMSYSTGWAQPSYFTVVGIQQVVFCFLHSDGVRESLAIFVPKALLPDLKVLFKK